jgi:hypothetical protein
MNLRVPDSGSLLGALLDSLGQTSELHSGDQAIASVTPAQLDEALAALTRGDIEYVVIEDGERFLQAAGDGEGPYSVQVDDGTLREISGGTDAATMRRIMHAYLAGDARWRDGAWTDVG